MVCAAVHGRLHFRVRVGVRRAFYSLGFGVM